jgi:hypothetical protein
VTERAGDRHAVAGRPEVGVEVRGGVDAEPFQGLALRPIAGTGPSRDVYALLPPGGRPPLLTAALDALDGVTVELQRATGR